MLRFALGNTFSSTSVVGRLETGQNRCRSFRKLTVAIQVRDKNHLAKTVIVRWRKGN